MRSPTTTELKKANDERIKFFFFPFSTFVFVLIIQTNLWAIVTLHISFVFRFTVEPEIRDDRELISNCFFRRRFYFCFNFHLSDTIAYSCIHPNELWLTCYTFHWFFFLDDKNNVQTRVFRFSISAVRCVKLNNFDLNFCFIFFFCLVFPWVFPPLYFVSTSLHTK